MILLLGLLVLARLREFLAKQLRRVADRRLAELSVLAVDVLRLGVYFARFVVGLAFWSASVFAACPGERPSAPTSSPPWRSSGWAPWRRSRSS